MKRMLLAIILSGTALAGHAAALSEGSTTQANVSFAQQTGTTNILNAQTTTNLKGGEPLANGQLLAVGAITSLHDPEIYEVDLNAENVNAGTYNSHSVVTAGLHGNNSHENMLYVALESITPNDNVAVDVNGGIVLNKTATAKSHYNIISLKGNGISQTVPADTYTVKTTSYIWAE